MPTGTVRRVALAAVLALLAAGCYERPEVRDVVGLWAGADQQAEASPTVDLQLEIVFVQSPNQNGCWSARYADGGTLRPVRWPEGTLVGIGAVLELPDGSVVANRDVVLGRGVDVGEASPFEVDAPAGCSVANGFFGLAGVTEVLDPAEG